MRYLVQSLETGRFLAPGPHGPEWVLSLREAGGGVMTDEEELMLMACEYAEQGERVQVIDLDRLGTASDY